MNTFADVSVSILACACSVSYMQQRGNTAASPPSHVVGDDDEALEDVPPLGWRGPQVYCDGENTPRTVEAGRPELAPFS